MQSSRLRAFWQLAGMHIIAASLLVGCSDNSGDGPRVQRINCVNNLKQIGLAFRTWSLDNGGQYPCNVSTNAGGVMEVCAIGPDGFDSNAAPHFQVMSNELSTPVILICPKDRSNKPAADFATLKAANITYRLRSGTNINYTNSAEILVVCLMDGNILYCDGTVKEGKSASR